MAITSLHAFLIHPGKHSADAPLPSGKELAQAGELYDLLESIFSAAPDKRDFDITFTPAAGGVQQNACRDLLVGYQQSPTLQTGLLIAQRLQGATDNRSGMGLLFLICGTHGLLHRLVVSRFPAHEGILAQVEGGGLDVAFLKEVFIKNMSAYKALQIEHQNPLAGFWNAMATDRQAGGSAENISNYWITDFLAARFTDTSEWGTRRLAEALRKAAKVSPNLDVKSEIASAASLAAGAFAGQQTSIDAFCQHFGFSNATRETVINQLPKAALAGNVFVFSANEFKEKIPYRTVEMDNGAILSAPSGDFDAVFEVRKKADSKVEYATTGRVSDQRMVKIR